MDADGFHENNNFPKENERETNASPETPAPNRQEYSASVAPTPVNNAPQTQAPIADTPTASTPIIPASQNNAGIIILQWLAYAFWGWLIASLAWVIAIVLLSSILNASVEGAVPYALAATIVLLPIAFVTDFFYVKREPVKKTGAAMAVMSIHAVMYALLGIGALITAVFTGLFMVINSSDMASGYTVTLLTSLALALLYAGTFIRIINPRKTQVLPRVYGYAMLAITIGLVATAIVGPFTKSLLTRDDRLIEQNLSSVESSVESYIRQNNKLPASLSDVTITPNTANELVASGKVTYKPGKVSSTSTTSTTYYPTYSYQLCVTFKAAKGSQSEQSRYRTYTSGATVAHGAGNTCYDLSYKNYQY